MRISNDMINRMAISSVTQSRTSLYELQKRIASGKKILKPSDDPGLFETIQRLRDEVAANTQYTRNSIGLEKDLISVETQLQNMLSIFQRSSEITVRAGDATTSPSDRVSMGHEVDELLKNLINIANSSEAGRYSFSGLRTDTPPYVTADTNGDGRIDSVTYQGSQEIKQVEIAKGTFIEANIPGSHTTGENAAFQTRTTDLFNSLIQLRDQLLAGNSTLAAESFTADPGTDVLAVSGIYTTGTQVTLSSGGVLPAGLSAQATYYAISGPGGIRLATSLENARNGIAIDITDAGTGTHTVTPATLRELTGAMDHIINLLSVNGARQESMRLNMEIISARDINLNNALEKTESLDIAEAIMQLSQLETAYQAVLRSSATLLSQRTLIDWL